MENKEQQILTEIRSIMASIRSQMDLLDAKMAEYQQTAGTDPEDLAPIDLEIDVETVEIKVVDDDLPSDDLPFEDVPVEEVHAQDLQDEDLPEDEVEESIFGFIKESVSESSPESEYVPVVESVEPEPAVIDTMTARHPWRTDMPGTAVKDIRSAISLNDRIIFINYLFNEDPMHFQETLNRINQMSSFDEAVNYVMSEHSVWDLDSEVVYRFMMAVRRRLR